MHGRLKVKSTAEQLEAKRKEREKKLQLYNAATSKIFSKRKAGELDEELLLLSGEVLAVNPDYYTLWNYRKETFLKFQKSKSKEELQKMFQSELYFLETCLKINPKSYGSWHHRCFVMDNMPEPDWKRELELCNQFLQYDERNFHCWDYRRFVVRRANIPPEAEFEFSMSKISNNFSNYSSWHYRSKLLPIIYPDPFQPMGVSEEALLKEYELVQNGFFTDPDDQSNWFYHRWLMGRGEQKQAINCLSLSRTESCAIVSFVKHIQMGKDTNIIVENNGKRLGDITWRNHGKNNFFSTLWIADNLILPKNEDCSLSVRLFEKNLEVCSMSLDLLAKEDSQSVCGVSKVGCSRFREAMHSQELSSVKSETLQQELESISQLMEMETDNKWAVLTNVLLMKSLDPVKYETEIMSNLEKLEALDFKRSNYYKDLRSKFIMENFLDVAEPKTSSIDLSGKGLTKLYHTELLPLVTKFDLSANKLSDVKHFNYLQGLMELNLSGNDISSCVGLEHLPKLEKLYLNSNNLTSPECFQPLSTCPKLKVLDVSENPVSESETSLEGLRELLPSTEIICKKSS